MGTWVKGVFLGVDGARQGATKHGQELIAVVQSDGTHCIPPC